MSQRFLTAVMLCLSCVTSFGVNPPTGRYKTIVDALNTLAAKHSDIAQVFSIGQNDEGTEIYAIRISTNPTVMDPTKVGHVIVSTHHGNESKAPEFTMKYINSLLSRYRSEELWKGRLADIEWSIIPVLNVTGYNANNRYEYGKDPNRDYPSPCLSSPGGKLKSIRTYMEFLTKRTFSGSLTVHGYDGSLTYPWGMYTDNYKTLDHNLFHQITEKAGQVNGYRVGTAAEVVYPANGCYEDFAYWKYGMWSLLLELQSGSDSDINATVPAIAKYFDQLDSSPSLKNQFTGNCTQHRGPDLRME